MKKLICALVKLVAALAVISALLYAAVLYWDKIMAVVARIKTMLPDALKVRADGDAEAEDYADWDLEMISKLAESGPGDAGTESNDHPPGK